ncbi:SRPBCC family protein [Celeribacter sp.]|uniref:SRPBCC family protein n=1 Tax=Celeribacter sp. TaxID=1890673 RepID=UPI003A9078F4
MKFSTHKDIDAPAEYVFERISNFEALERQAMRRGIEVARKDPAQSRGVGAGWTMKVPFRGKTRDLEADVVAFSAPSGLAVNAKSDGLDMVLVVDLVALSPKRTRLAMTFDVKPQTLSARILVQSIKFAKGTLDRRYERKIGQFCSTIREDYDKTRMA